MPTYRSLVQRGPLLLFAPGRTRSVARDGGRAGDWLAEGGGERRSDSGGSRFSIYSFHLYWSAHGWRASTQGSKVIKLFYYQLPKHNLLIEKHHCAPATMGFPSQFTEGNWLLALMRLEPVQSTRQTQEWSEASWMRNPLWWQIILFNSSKDSKNRAIPQDLKLINLKVGECNYQKRSICKPLQGLQD